MAWQERTVEIMREEFVKRALSMEKSKAALCREYGISRPTGDKWISRFLAGEPMSNQSRAPQIQARRVSAAAEADNDMWQADFKGHFQMQNGERCYPLNILDDCSRFCLCSDALRNETLGEVKPVFQRLFKEYGLPFSLLCDNGNPWGTSQSMGYTAFEVWLMELGVLTIHGRPLHPQTQGKDERYNRSFTRECLNVNSFLDIADAQLKFDAYRSFYNNIRPHCALDLNVPSAVFQKSEHPFPEKVIDWEYGPEYQRCKVSETGYFSYGGHRYFLSEGFRARVGAPGANHIGVQTVPNRPHRLGQASLHTQKVLSPGQ